jgi:hypothetical protein
MEEAAPAALRVIRSCIDALGRGFDANLDTRLLYCKGSRLVQVDDDELSSRDLVVSDGLTVPGVPKDVDCLAESGAAAQETAGPCGFYEVLLADSNLFSVSEFCCWFSSFITSCMIKCMLFLYCSLYPGRVRI